MPSTLANRRAPRPIGGSPAYRADLDGLRGLAILLVVVFHIWVGRVSGGVDVFLCLSGFFFLGSLLRSATTPGGTLNPLPQLGRLIRRLYPALVVTVGATVALTLALEPRTRWLTVFTQAVASLSYVQNWRLALTSQDYAAADASVSPLQHLWSMSVQGQFYVLALVLVLGLATLWRVLLHRTPRAVLLGVVVTGAIVSLVYAARGHLIHQSWTYYDTAARLWELLLGGLAAVVVSRLVLPRPLRLVATATGLALVVSSGFVWDGAREFPGPAAWYPVGGALLLIIGGALPAGTSPRLHRDPVAWLLALPVLRRLGEVSYSLYLWHWPLLIFWMSWTERDRVGVLDGVLLLALSLGLATLTERHIERPLRLPSRARRADTPAARARDDARPTGVGAGPRSFHRRPASVAALAVVTAATLGTASVAGYWTLTQAGRASVPYVDAGADAAHPGARHYLEDLPAGEGVPFVPSALQVENDVPATIADHCIADFDATDVVTCVYGETDAKRTIALVGGSHAEHWITALDPIGKHYGFRVVTVLKMGCPMTLDGKLGDTGDSLYPNCEQWTPKALSTLFSLKPEWVFTTATRPSSPLGPDSTPRQYVDLWKALSHRGIGVLAARDTPWVNHGSGAVRAGDCLAGGGSPVDCGMGRSQAVTTINPAALAAVGIPGVRLIDLTEALCGPLACPVVVGNVVVYHDSHHLSATFVRSAGPELARQIGVATRWW